MESAYYKLPFLDCLFGRQHNHHSKVDMLWKSKCSGKYLDRSSTHSHPTKKAVAKHLINRVQKLGIKRSDKETGMNLVMSTMEMNNHARDFTKSVIKK